MASTNSAPSAVHSRAPSPRTTEMNAGRAGLAKGWRKLSTTDEKVVADCRQRSPGKAPRSAILVRMDRDTTMCIVTWNLQGSVGVDIDGVADVVRRAAPDVVVLQEVGWLQARRLARRAGDAAVLGVQAPRLAPPGGTGCAHAPSSRRRPTLRAAPRTVVGLAAEDRHQRRGRSGGRSAQCDQRSSVAARRQRQSSTGGRARRRRRQPASPPTGDRRRLQRPARRPRAGRSGGCGVGRRVEARAPGWRRRVHELDSGRRATAARPPSDSTTSSCRLAGRWSTPRCWPQWSASTGSPSVPITCQCRRSSNHTGTMSEALLDRIRKLLAKAESTDNANEAEVFSAKAAQLIAEHRIDPTHVRDALDARVAGPASYRRRAWCVRPRPAGPHRRRRPQPRLRGGVRDRRHRDHGSAGRL